MTMWLSPRPFRLLFSIVVVFLFMNGAAWADAVTPSSNVKEWVNIRASAAGPNLGKLRVGEQLDLIQSGVLWHEVRLADGTHGFVPARWTRVIRSGGATAVGQPSPATPLQVQVTQLPNAASLGSI